jgi:hypothetical protein
MRLTAISASAFALHFDELVEALEGLGKNGFGESVWSFDLIVRFGLMEE